MMPSPHSIGSSQLRDYRDLRPFLEAQLQWERCRRARAILVVVLAISSSVLWLMVARPEAWGTVSRAAALAGWLLLTAAAVGSALAERFWSRSRERRLRSLLQREEADAA